MSQTSNAIAARPVQPITLKWFFSPENRYLAPMFITCILIVGHLSFGILERLEEDGHRHCG